MSTKSDLLTEMRSLYKEVIPPQGNPELVETVGDVKKYLFHHLVTGKDQDAGPVAHKSFKVFYVWKDGDVAEEAYYEDTTAKNNVDKNIVAVNPSAPTAMEIYSLYTSNLVRNKVRGLMVRSANDIYNESLASTTMLYDATSGQKVISVNNRLSFYEGKTIIVKDDVSSEEGIIDIITPGSGDTGNLTMKSNLTNSYTVAANGKVTFKNNNERMKWATNILQSIETEINVTMSFVAMNATILGGTYTDEDLRFIVNSNITKWAALEFLA